ncbi:unnamed protein product [[Candida] boidinii]|nr:unnamed protein product [[Candida] boidinii]
MSIRSTSRKVISLPLMMFRILEAMKMEIPIKIKDKKAGEGAKYEILETIINEGDIVNPGDLLTVLKRLD